MLSSFFILLSLATANSSTITVSNQGGEDFTTIQAAIDAARPGDTVEVQAGTYRENVVVNKTLIMRGMGLPVVDGLGNDSAITLEADGVVLEGFRATNSSEYFYYRIPPIPEATAGILVLSDNNTLIGNNASYNLGWGILLIGSYNHLMHNIASNNSRDGIKIGGDGRNNVLEDNIVSNNNVGISLVTEWPYPNNTLRHNQIFGNKENLVDAGGNNNVDASNLIEGVPVA
jgi:parallel beta-helix repeat protein